ncbi:DUF397 domain-containing protein [Actinomadura logoneensis]|uniref:DUF397 domain-containing protein n=1 Tax=Actinomadura logoneensis TaxID=2293572 RepID=A0A372JS77_9ACTN|nr:DUF397 domain-containing protein [Actinomadura logoneensis]RFU42800.1 DUF397 domain-containing protein [Actinomadura logoneensis]
MSEAGVRWRKSSYSGATGSTECVEVAVLNPAVGIRDSKAPDEPHLRVSPQAFGALLTALRRRHESA